MGWGRGRSQAPDCPGPRPCARSLQRGTVRGECDVPAIGQGIWVTWGLHLVALTWEQGCGQQVPPLPSCPLYRDIHRTHKVLPSPFDPSLPHPRESQIPVEGRAPGSALHLVHFCRSHPPELSLELGMGEGQKHTTVQPGQGLYGAKVPGVAAAIQVSPLSPQ